MPITIHDSITKLHPEDEGSVAIAASHGGVYPGYLTAKGKLQGVVLSDAGIGLERAGLGSLAYLDGFGIPAATVDYRTARIGDGADLERRGIISFVNETARALGCAPGQTARECAEKMLAAKPSSGEAPHYDESRFLLRDGDPKVWGLDSVSLVRPEDAGSIVVTASHGALLAGQRDSAVSADVLAAVFNDAGVGIDDAGISRLPALDERNIAGVTVSASSARIGDARSAWETGRISHANKRATQLGAVNGMSLPEFADLVVLARQ
jgi:ribosomal protein L12E/L44/L45/RPP1/RPP2